MRTTFVKFFAMAAAVLSLTAMNACSKSSTDTPGGDDEKAAISIDPAAIICGSEGASEKVTVKANGAWVVTVASAASDVTVSPERGNGNGSFTVNIPAFASDRAFEIKIECSKPYTIAGYTIVSTTSTTLSVNQGSSTKIYSENCGTAVQKVDGYWPYVNDYAGWDPQSPAGIDQSGVKYVSNSATKASVRNSGAAWAPGEGAQFTSDAPYVYIGKADAQFNIEGINLKQGDKSYILRFTAFDTYASLIASPYTPATVVPSNDNMGVFVSVDGQKFAKVNFTATADGANGWYVCEAPFTLPSEASSINVRFGNFVPDTTTALPSAEYQYQASLRIDDFVLSAGGDGPVLDFDGPEPDPSTTVTIDKITKEGQYKVENATVMATYQSGFVMSDASGASILVYQYVKDTQIFVPAVGDKVTVEGTVGTYNTMLQFTSDPTVTVTGSGTANLPAIQDYSYNDVLQYAKTTAPKPVYVRYKGKLSVSGNYNNVIFAEGTDVQGSISYPNPELDVASFNGKDIIVEGYLIGWTSNGKYASTLCTKISENTNAVSISVNPTSYTFTAEGGTQEFTVETKNAGTMKVFASLSGDSAFTASATELQGDKVSVTVGANTGAKREATLTLKLANSAAEQSEYTVNVKLTQVAPSSGKGFTIIDSADLLVAGDYYMSGLAEKYQTTEWGEYKYHIWNGLLKNDKDLETVRYKVDEQSMTKDTTDTTTTDITKITVEKVAGKANTFCFKVGDQYLNAGSANRTLSFSATAVEWTASANSKGGIDLECNGTHLGTAGAQSAILRNYANAATPVYGVIFIKDFDGPETKSMSWQFSSEAWQKEFAKMGEAGKDISGTWDITIDGLNYSATKSRWTNKCIQVTQDGRADGNGVFTFTTPAAGTVTVSASGTGSAPSGDRNVVITTGGASEQVSANCNVASNGTPATATFTVAAGEQKLYVTDALRIYSISYDPAK